MRLLAKRRMPYWVTLVLAGAPAIAAGPAEPPAWFLEHVEFMTRDGGCWFTENFAYRSEAEPYDGYGLEWWPGLGGKSLEGRLFSRREGREAGVPWQYRAFWHPGERRVLAYQFGSDGSLGTGVMEPMATGGIRLEQTFFWIDGNSLGVGHESPAAAPDGSLVVRSFRIGADGSWTEDRTYTWRRRDAADCE